MKFAGYDTWHPSIKILLIVSRNVSSFTSGKNGGQPPPKNVLQVLIDHVEIWFVYSVPPMLQCVLKSLAVTLNVFEA